MEKKGSSGLNIALIHPDLGIGTFQVTVYGAFLPRHIFYHLHAVCAYLRCIFVAVCVLFMWPSFDVVLADQVSAVIPLMKLKKSTKVGFYCHFPDLLLAQHTTILRQIYRKPIDFIEEVTTVQVWADMLLRMYVRWGEKQRYKTKVVEMSSGEEAGIKSATVEVEGRYAYGYFSGEKGTHHIMRLSPFNAKGLRQETSPSYPFPFLSFSSSVSLVGTWMSKRKALDFWSYKI
ncbi:uncharacterized protein LOC131331509 isoform X3 [Rhododendron vialii]|uniref:uncharacterized protein LOC131331509 isoform X3 n=1 Tax=Rhododendron vialii TaxID=182163 RepID=UPI00265E62AF|nr:uncharacterized protein LOC131331509 isoform X3 [Rhododendron vialii]